MKESALVSVLNGKLNELIPVSESFAAADYRDSVLPFKAAVSSCEFSKCLSVLVR